MLRVLTVIVAFFSTPLAAETSVQNNLDGPCISNGGPHNCVENFACIGEQGRWFEGRAIGWNSGTLIGRTNDGVNCNGNWWVEPSGIGRADMMCEDGTTARVVSEYQDYNTGTTIGVGTTGDGEKVRSFSGRNVIDFLNNDGVSVLQCGDTEIEIDGGGAPIA